MKGDRLGPYRVLGELGSGSTAKVYLAEVVGEVPELDAGRHVALKLLHPQFEAAPRVLRRFRQEVDVGRTLRHENVVRLLDAGEIQLSGSTRHYLAMEYIQGRTLRELITGEGVQPEALCRHVGCEVARGLVAIHDRGAVHRDIKPENIVLTEDERVKIMDLGIARLRGESGRISPSEDFVGSLLYAPPEQFLGPPDRVDGRADLYALGLTLYELATGTHPFERDTIEEVMQLQLSATPQRPGALQPRLSPFFEYVLLRLLKKSPAQRFRNARRLYRTLEEAEESSWWRDRRRILGRIRKRRPGPRVPRATSVVGRASAHARLRTLWDDVCQKRGQVLLVEGEAGVGKSRFVDEFAAQLYAAGEQLHLLYAAWPAVGPSTAAGALCTAWREHFGRDGLEDAIAPFLTQSPALVPAFAAFLRGEQQPAGAIPLDEEAMHAAYLGVTRALALEKPTLVVLEDLQHATPAAREVVTTLARGIAASRVFLILTTRGGTPASGTAELLRLRHGGGLRLDRLQEQDVRRVLEEALGSAELATQLAPSLTSMSDGNPLFLLEILQELKKSGTLVAGEGGSGWTLVGSLWEIEAPPRLQDLVHARLAGLAAQEREVLDAASTFGFEFNPTLLAEVLDRPLLGVLQTLGRLERTNHLVRSRGSSCTFDHHVLQEVLDADLPPLLRRAYHSAIGEALQRAFREADPDGATAVETCLHFLQADRASAAIRWLAPALDHLEKGHLNARATELIDQVLTVPGLLSGSPRAELLLRKAERLRLLGRAGEESRVLEEAARCASPKHDPLLASTASTRLGDHLRMAGHVDRALTFLNQAIILARRAGSQGAEMEATSCLGVALDELGRHAEARSAQQHCLEYACRTGDDRAEARARAQLARSLYRLGETDEALEELRAGVALFEFTGDLLEQGTAAAELGSLLVALGRYDEALPHIECGLEVAQTVGHRAGVATSLADLGTLNLSRGQLADAGTCFRRSLAIRRQCGNPLDLGVVLTQLGAFELLVGWPQRARASLEEARERLRQVGYAAGEAWAALYLARVTDEEHGPEAAREPYRQALRLCERSGSDQDHAAIRISWALGLFWGGAHETAQEVLALDGRPWQATDSRDVLLLGRALELALGRDGDALAARRMLGPPTTPVARYEAHALLFTASGGMHDLEAAWREIVALRESAPLEAWNDFLGGARVRRRILRDWESAHASPA